MEQLDEMKKMMDISHPDILLEGASSVYGSDAVAGVVNVLLKKDFEGFDFIRFTFSVYVIFMTRLLHEKTRRAARQPAVQSTPVESAF